MCQLLAEPVGFRLAYKFSLCPIITHWLTPVCYSEMPLGCWKKLGVSCEAQIKEIRRIREENQKKLGIPNSLGKMASLVINHVSSNYTLMSIRILATIFCSCSSFLGASPNWAKIVQNVIFCPSKMGVTLQNDAQNGS